MTLTVNITKDGTTVAWIGDNGESRIARLDASEELAVVTPLYRVVERAYALGEEGPR